MSFIAQDVLLEVRDMVQDTLPEYRYSDSFLLRKLDLIMRSTVVLRPDLFTHVAPITCVAGAMQSAPADSVRLMDVLRNQDDYALKEVNQEALDLLQPGWPGVSNGAAKDWMRYPRDPNRFFVSPPAQAGDTLTIVYARSTPVTSLGQTINLQDSYLAALAYGVVWLIESVDAEHVESGRAKLYKDAYDSILAAGLTTRQITDDAAAGAGG